MTATLNGTGWRGGATIIDSDSIFLNRMVVVSNAPASTYTDLKMLPEFTSQSMNEYFRFYNDTPLRGFYARMPNIVKSDLFCSFFSFSQIITISDRKIPD